MEPEELIPDDVLMDKNFKKLGNGAKAHYAMQAADDSFDKADYERAAALALDSIIYTMKVPEAKEHLAKIKSYKDLIQTRISDDDYVGAYKAFREFHDEE